MIDIPGADARYEPRVVKKALPVEWALGYLLGVWGAGSGSMIQCPLPGHENERTASFNLWAPNQDNMPMRFGCFGCGRQGDVIDLIREVRGLEYHRALDLAVDEMIPEFERSDWTPGIIEEVKPAASPLALTSILYATESRPGYLEQFMENKDLDIPVAWVEGEWEWVGTYIGMPVIVFPHRDWDGTLRGIKYRSLRRGNRWNEKGSRFEALYGAHRDRGYENVVIAEGETDTICAAWQLDREPIDAFGLASGAGQKPPEETVSRLKGRRVFLGFDGDLAGRIAEKRWREALEKESDVFSFDMPDGEDICSCGTPVLELMEDAK